MKHFEEEVQNGNWDEVEKYLSGFTKVDDNRYSMKIFFEIRKQKYLEALDKYAFIPLLYYIRSEAMVLCITQIGPYYGSISLFQRPNS